jgi:hypothetical protein
MTNGYLIEGPYQHPNGYFVRRVICGLNMAYAVCAIRSRSAAVTHAKRLRSIDAKTMPERKSWPIVDKDYGMIIERR